MSHIIGQVYILTIASIKARYRKTIAGLFWVVLSPIIMFSVQSFVFQNFLNIRYADYPLFLLGGLLPWIFIASSIEVCLPQLLNSSEMLKSFNFNPVILVLSKVLDNALNFIIAFALILTYQSLTSKITIAGLLCLPLAFFQLLLGVLGMVWLLAMLQVFYRDIRFVMQFVVSVAFFVTPILYPISFVPEQFRFLVSINPIYILISPVRTCVSSFSLDVFLTQYFLGLALSICILGLAIIFWKKRRNEFYLRL